MIMDFVKMSTKENNVIKMYYMGRSNESATLLHGCGTGRECRWWAKLKRVSQPQC